MRAWWDYKATTAKVVSIIPARYRILCVWYSSVSSLLLSVFYVFLLDENPYLSLPYHDTSAPFIIAASRDVNFVRRIFAVPYAIAKLIESEALLRSGASEKLLAHAPALVRSAGTVLSAVAHFLNGNNSVFSATANQSSHVIFMFRAKIRLNICCTMRQSDPQQNRNLQIHAWMTERKSRGI